MSRQTTYLEFDKISILIRKLEKDGEHRFSLLISLGVFLGLRISDLLNLKWSDIRGKDRFEIVEKKTKKSRILPINEDLKVIIDNSFTKIGSSSDYIFINRFGTRTITIQYVNRKLKQIFRKNKLLNGHPISSHLLRKTFGRNIYLLNNESEHSLILLSNIFGHSSISITRLYLGLRQEEILKAYNDIRLL